MNELENLVT